jgi:hypothetical protein
MELSANTICLNKLSIREIISIVRRQLRERRAAANFARRRFIAGLLSSELEIISLHDSITAATSRAFNLLGWHQTSRREWRRTWRLRVGQPRVPPLPSPEEQSMSLVVLHRLINASASHDIEREWIRRPAAADQEALAGPSPSPLVSLLARQVVIAGLDQSRADQAVIDSGPYDPDADFLNKRQCRAAQRLRQAARTLMLCRMIEGGGPPSSPRSQRGTLSEPGRGRIQLERGN